MRNGREYHGRIIVESFDQDVEVSLCGLVATTEELAKPNPRRLITLSSAKASTLYEMLLILTQELLVKFGKNVHQNLNITLYTYFRRVDLPKNERKGIPPTFRSIDVDNVVIPRWFEREWRKLPGTGPSWSFKNFAVGEKKIEYYLAS